jgi:hypothetical protein
LHPKAIRRRAIHMCTQRAILFNSLTIVRASREGSISSIWTHHPPTSCTISVYTEEYWQFFNPLDDDDAVTMDTPQHARAAGTGPPAWPPRGARSDARPTPSTTHSANGTDDVAAQRLRARRARSVRRRGGGAGCADAPLVAGGTGGLLLPSPGARVWFPPKVVASGKASKLSAFHLVQ